MERAHEHSTAPSGLQDYVRLLRRYRWFIAAVTLLFVGASVAYSLRQDEVYSAEAALAFQEPGQEAAVLGAFTFSGQTAEQRAAVGARTVTNPEITAAVQKRVDLSKGNVSLGAQAEARTNFVILQARANDPKLAATVANVYADEAERRITLDFRREVERAIHVAEDEFRTTRRFKDNDVVILQQRERLGKLRSLRRLGDPVNVARTASVASSPISPRPVRNAILALVVGLTLAIILAFAREALDRRLRTSEDVRESTGLPVVGHVRDSAFDLKWLGEPSPESEGELAAFSILRTNLDYLSPDSPLTTILVTSSLPEEGKSTVSISLAVAAALRGERALLVGCDLRRPVLAERLGIEAGPGLADFLGGRATPADCVQIVEFGRPAPAVDGMEPSEPRRIAVVTAGSPAPNPGELLRTKRFAQFLADVGSAYDCVIIDSPPLLPVADALEIERLADGVVLCVRAMRTTRDELRAAKRQLDQVSGKPIAVVVTGALASEEPGYGYSYYAYAYGGGARA
jgi:capsular exopolysaccharide synthesis family protein